MNTINNEITGILNKIDLGIDTDKDLDRLFELRATKTVKTFGKFINSKDQRRTSKSNINI